MDSSSHPSFLQLDRFALDPSSLPEGTKTHVAGCEQCHAHLKKLEMDFPVPAWVREPRKPSPWMAILRGLALAAVTATAGVIAVHRASVAHLPPAIDVEKGSGPALSLYVKRGAAVELWDGHQPVHPGDSLRLEVAAERPSHIEVSAVGDASPQMLYQGELPTAAPTFLPVSWRVDDAPGPEVLQITLSSPGLSPWTSRLTLPKAP